MSLTNPYFLKNHPTEQNYIESLITESVRVMGQVYYYLPREIQREDLILGEDVISKFGFAMPIDMYHESQKGWTADTAIIGKFGLTIHNEIVFTMSKKSWDNEIMSYPLIKSMKTKGIRPQEGDLIYEPTSRSLLEIKYVKDTNSDFFQLGRVYQFSLTCEFFNYDSELIETGIEDIDAFNKNSLDLLNEQLLDESGDYLVDEDCGMLLQDTIETSTLQDTKYGTDFKQDSVNIGFNVNDPFGEMN